MAAEILKTVLVRELNELVVLGAVIILRALLSFLIHFEMKQPHSSCAGRFFSHIRAFFYIKWKKLIFCSGSACIFSGALL